MFKSLSPKSETKEQDYLLKITWNNLFPGQTFTRYILLTIFFEKSISINFLIIKSHLSKGKYRRTDGVRRHLPQIVKTLYLKNLFSLESVVARKFFSAWCMNFSFLLRIYAEVDSNQPLLSQHTHKRWQRWTEFFYSTHTPFSTPDQIGKAQWSKPL